MPIAKLFLVGTFLALLIAPSSAMAQDPREEFDARDRFEKVLKQRDLAAQTFNAAVARNHFESSGDIDQVHAMLELANTLLREARWDLRQRRANKADAKSLAAHTLIKEAYNLSKE